MILLGKSRRAAGIYRKYVSSSIGIEFHVKNHALLFVSLLDSHESAKIERRGENEPSLPTLLAPVSSPSPISDPDPDPSSPESST